MEELSAFLTLFNSFDCNLNFGIDYSKEKVYFFRRGFLKTLADYLQLCTERRRTKTLLLDTSSHPTPL